MKTRLLTFALATLPIGAFGGLLLNLNQYTDGDSAEFGPAPISPVPLTALFQDSTDGLASTVVYLTMSAPNLTGFVDDWAFTYSRALDLSFSVVSVSGGNINDYVSGDTPVMASPGTLMGFKLDFGFDFPTSSGDTRFTDDESITIAITRTGGEVLSAYDFMGTNINGFITAAHINDATPGNSEKIGATTFVEIITIIPEPNALILAVTGLFGLFLIARKR